MERLPADKQKNVLLYHKTETYDEFNRLIREEEFDDNFGEEDIQYRYSGS